ncbi:MAG: hypothetical protein WC081_04225 [Candidatus Ratteibacteria bacterium]
MENGFRLLFQFLAALATTLAAVAAWQATRETQKKTAADILMKITDAYASPEMLTGMKLLSEWQKNHGENFAKVFGELRRSNYDEIEQIDKARRRFSHYFHQIRLLLECGYVDKFFVKKTVSKEQVEFLLRIIEPLGKSLNPDYDQTTFRTVEAIFSKEKILKYMGT